MCKPGCFEDGHNLRYWVQWSHSKWTETYLLGLFPIYVLVSEVGEVPELELQGRSFRSTNEAGIVAVWHAFLTLEVDGRKWEAHRCVKHRKKTVSEVLRFLKENGIPI